MASLSYRLLEQAAFSLNRMSGGAFKRAVLGINETTPGLQPRQLPLSMRRRFDIETLEIDGHTAHIVRSKRQTQASEQSVGFAHTALRKDSDKAPSTILFLAGGGGMATPTEFHYTFASRLIEHTGAEVWFGLYPLAPTYEVKAALAWLEQIYAQMLERYQAHDIAFVGDSAGANLGLRLCSRTALKLRPSAIAAISPAAGLGDEYRPEREQAVANDPLLALDTIELISERWGRLVELSDPDIEPLSIDYTNFPRTLVAYGTHEIFSPVMPRLLDAIRSAGVDVVELKGEDLCHDFPLIWMLPDAREAQNRIFDFLGS